MSGAALEDVRDPLSSLERARRLTPAVVSPLHPAESAEWHYDADRIAHRTGRFFSIVGLEYSENGVVRAQPIIDQPEVGTLAFLFRASGDGIDVLTQIKAEPGNVHDYQLAPTCQATRSNLDRAHGGADPPGFELAEAADGPWQVLANSLQSEQGTRFFRKRNRNLSLLVDRGMHACPPSAGACVWVDSRALLRRLRRDFTVNADARSVLVSTPWRALAHTGPFESARDPFGRLLRRSYLGQEPSDAEEQGTAVVAWMHGLQERRGGCESRLVPLATLGGAINADGYHCPGADFSVRHVAVRIPGREREAWDQPLLESRDAGLLRLSAFVDHGHIKFVFRAVTEPGLANHVELHPTVVVRPGAASLAGAYGLEAGATIVAEVRQSEEGGRFFRDTNLHQIVLSNRPCLELPRDHVALSLPEIEWLAPRSVFTNEARSVISLLLSYR